MSQSKITREHKGKSIIDFPNNYTVIDIETTGFDPTYDSIIELSAIKYINFEEIESYRQLVNPESTLDSFITALTGLSSATLSKQPCLNDVLPDFLDFIGNSILIGQNVNFDINFLYDSSMRILNKPICNDFIDTMRISRRLHPDLKHHRLDDLIELYQLEDRDEHRAYNDCVLTNLVFISQRNEALEKYGNIQDFQSQFKKGVHSTNTLHASDIQADSDLEFDETHPLFNKLCVFTGTLQQMPRKEAMQHVVNLGGLVGDSVTKKTNYLILGNNDYCKTIKDGKSSKQKKAEELKLKGNDIEIISENVFYDMLDQ